MPISSALKIASVSVGVGGVATGAVLVSGGFLKDESKTTKTIESLIPKGKRLLDKNKDKKDKWQANWDGFKKAYNEKDPKEIGKGWEFKEKCINNSKGNVKGDRDPLFVAIKDYCLTDKGND